MTPILLENPIISGDRAHAMAATLDGLEGLTDGEKFVALFYEVRQARIDFGHHMQSDADNFSDIKVLLEEIKARKAQVVLASKIASRVARGIAFVMGATGLGAYLWHRWFGF